MSQLIAGSLNTSKRSRLTALTHAHIARDRQHGFRAQLLAFVFNFFEFVRPASGDNQPVVRAKHGYPGPLSDLDAQRFRYTNITSPRQGTILGLLRDVQVEETNMSADTYLHRPCLAY